MPVRLDPQTCAPAPAARPDVGKTSSGNQGITPKAPPRATWCNPSSPGEGNLRPAEEQLLAFGTWGQWPTSGCPRAP